MIRVLVIDDSAYTRRTLRSMLETSDRIEVVGVAMDGEQGLRSVHELRPDVITLDLEMPRINGFAFLRILMRRQPTPVIVVSSWAGREDVLRALELGALDFVAKPAKSVGPALLEIQNELIDKVIEASYARMDVYLEDRPVDVTGFFTLPDAGGGKSQRGEQPAPSAPSAPSAPPPPPARSPDPVDAPHMRDKSMTGAYRLLTEQDLRDVEPEAPPPSTAQPRRGRLLSPPRLVSLSVMEEEAARYEAPVQGVVVVGASTGGPRAIRKILQSLERPLSWPMVVVQHMPPKFTNEFAIRLRRKLGRDVREAADAERLAPGRVLIAPGGLHTEIEISAAEGIPFVRLRVPTPTDRYVPSVDRLFASASRVFGANVVGVVLTGMGNDGVQGVYAVGWAGGRVIAEDRSTAVVYGMPREAVGTGLVNAEAPLDRIGATILRLISLQS